MRLPVVVVRRTLKGDTFLGHARTVFAHDEKADGAQNKAHSAHERPRPKELHSRTVAVAA